MLSLGMLVDQVVEAVLKVGDALADRRVVLLDMATVQLYAFKQSEDDYSPDLLTATTLQ